MSRSDANLWLQDLKEGRVLSEKNFHELDVETYLDERDASPFADEWMKAYERYAQDSAVAEEEALHTCRELAFKQTLALTGDPELAGYVSDDIGLIGAALLQDAGQDFFVNTLQDRYRQGSLPLR